MAFLVKTATTLRTHWKKSIFFSGLAAYGIKYVNDRHNDNLLRRRYCEEAKRYGDEAIMLGHRPRRVTVFLNPAACGGKARKLFEKTAAPILYLSGIEVNVVPTEYEGQVKNFMAVLDTADTDAVVVAGGNGTLLEAVTGFLRKENKDFRENIPIGVIPIGTSNRFSKLIFGHDTDTVKAIAEAAIAVVRAVTKKVDVIKLHGEEGNPIYALTGLEIGAYRDAEERKTKYWYFGPLKHRWTYLRTAMKQWPPSFQAGVSYIEATEENTSYDESVLLTKPKAQSWSFTNFLLRRQQTNHTLEAEKARIQALKEIEEEQRVRKDVSTTEITVTLSDFTTANAPLKALQMSLAAEELSRTDFIGEGWKRMKKDEFSMGSENDKTLTVKTLRIEPKTEGSWFNIDGESFEAMPIDVTLLRQKLNFFCPRPELDAR